MIILHTATWPHPLGEEEIIQTQLGLELQTGALQIDALGDDGTVLDDAFHSLVDGNDEATPLQCGTFLLVNEADGNPDGPAGVIPQEIDTVDFVLDGMPLHICRPDQLLVEIIGAIVGQGRLLILVHRQLIHA